MANTLDTHIISFPIANTANDWQGDTVIANLFRAPAAANGGGITIVEASYTQQAADGAGTAFTLALLNYGTSGTALAGTIAAPLGGTADPWASGVPKHFTLDSTYKYVDAGQWVVLSKDETNSADPVRGVVQIHYVMGQ